jgi:hypothetical protein
MYMDDFSGLIIGGGSKKIYEYQHRERIAESLQQRKLAKVPAALSQIADKD